MRKILIVNNSKLKEAYLDSILKIGYTTFDFFESEEFKFNISIIDKYLNIFYRFIFKDTQYLNRIRTKQYDKYLTKLSKKINKDKYDYCIIFRADKYPLEVIKNLRDCSVVFVSYQYDGLTQNSQIFEYQKYIDRVYVFDKKDLVHTGFLPLTNHWFLDSSINNNNFSSDFFYIGVGTANRKDLLYNLINACQKSYNFDFTITIQPYFKEDLTSPIKLSHLGLSYSDNMKRVKGTKVIVDLKLDAHDGLSFRFFEALYYGKKIITNNPKVKEYDFYDPSFIFICDFINFSGLEEFLTAEINPPHPKIIQKYGIENWINYILQKNVFQPFIIH